MGRLTNLFKGFRSTFQLNADDIAVFVVGPTGSGKSLFVEQLTRSDLIRVGANLQPCTARVQAIRCELTQEAKAALGVATQKNIVFVDTPSFHTGRNDESVEKEMNSWLSKARSKSTRLGVIYMHRIETDPSYEPQAIQQHLDTFARTFPQDFASLPRRVHAVLSYEGVIPEDTVQSRRVTFQTQLDALRPSIWGRLSWITSSNSNLFQLGDPEIAWQAVVALFS